MEETLSLKEMNRQLVKIFNEMAKIEEKSLEESSFSDITIKELHTIEVIGLSGRRNTTEVARELDVTLGTVSVSIKKLVDKGYVERVRQLDDRRIFCLQLTPDGRKLYDFHQNLHHDMIEYMIEGLEKDDIYTINNALKNLNHFIDIKKEVLGNKEDGCE